MHRMISVLRDIRTTLDVIHAGTYLRGDRRQLVALVNEVLDMTKSGGHDWIESEDTDGEEEEEYGNDNF